MQLFKRSQEDFFLIRSGVDTDPLGTDRWVCKPTTHLGDIGATRYAVDGADFANLHGRIPFSHTRGYCEDCTLRSNMLFSLRMILPSSVLGHWPPTLIPRLTVFRVDSGVLGRLWRLWGKK
jgi:hypothetical protein